MAPRFTAKESLEYFRSRCALQSRELEKLKTEKGLNSYLKKCEEQAEERNKGLKADLAKSEREANKLRKTNEELNQKYDRLLASSSDLRAENKRLLNEIKALKEQIKAAETVSEKYTDLLKKNKELQDQHENDERKNLLLQKEVVSLGGKIEKAEHKRDSQNSGVPTSGNSFEKPVQNNRQSSGKKPGAVEGHEPSPRKTIEICGKVIAEVPGDQDPLYLTGTGYKENLMASTCCRHGAYNDKCFQTGKWYVTHTYVTTQNVMLTFVLSTDKGTDEKWDLFHFRTTGLRGVSC